LTDIKRDQRRNCWRVTAHARRDPESPHAVEGRRRITDQNPEAKYQRLERYARDLNEQARRGKLDRSSDAMRKFAASCKYFRDAQRIIRC